MGRRFFRLLDSQRSTRPLAILAVLAPVSLAARGSDKEKTVIVNPPPQTQVAPLASSTAVVPGTTKVCPPGYTAC